MLREQNTSPPEHHFIHHSNCQPTSSSPVTNSEYLRFETQAERESQDRSQHQTLCSGQVIVDLLEGFPEGIHKEDLTINFDMDGKVEKEDPRETPNVTHRRICCQIPRRSDLDVHHRHHRRHGTR